MKLSYYLDPSHFKWISIISVVTLIFSYLAFYVLYYGCNLEREHHLMTCPILYVLAYFPMMTVFRLNLISLCSDWGFCELKRSVRDYLDAEMFNTTETFQQFNLTGYPVLTEEKDILGTKVYIYTPVQNLGESDQPVFIYFHGGGGASGNPAYYDATIRYLVFKMGMKILVPYYQKSPYVVFPYIEEECFRVTRYLLENGASLGVDPTRISIGGDSYGGHLALYVVIKWKEMQRDHNYPPFKSITLLYPSIQWVNFELHSYTSKINQPRILSTQLITHYLSLGLSRSLDLVPYITNLTLPMLSEDYLERRTSNPDLLPPIRWNPPQALKDKYSKFADSVLSPYSSIMFLEDISYLPPTLIIAAEYDILFSEVLMFKEKLERNAVEFKYFLYEKMYHGFAFLLPPEVRFPDTLLALDDFVEFVLSY